MMKRRLFSLVPLLATALSAACVTSTNNGPPGTPDAGDGVDGGGLPDSATPPPDGGGADTGNDAPTHGCTAPTGAGVIHASRITADETWKAADGPHTLQGDVNILAKVTVEPCTAILISKQAIITVGAGGALVAEGNASQPITIGAKVAGQNWSHIRALGGGTMRLVYVTMDGGGDPLNTVLDLASALEINADQSTPPQETLHADHLTIKGSLSQGISITGSGGFSKTSGNVVITGSAGRPIYTWGNVAGTIPAGTYTGNAKDEILLAGGGGSYPCFWVDTTLFDRGVPYHVGTTQDAGDLRVDRFVGQTNVPLLTIQPGVHLYFKKGGVFHVSSPQTDQAAQAALLAAGTAAKPIVFASAEPTPAAGDWLGIWFGGAPDARTKMDFTTVQYAGGTSVTGSDSCVYPGLVNNDAAIRFLGGIPGGEIVTNSTIADSLNHGIDRGYRDDAKVPDFIPNNTFTAIARCKQTYPRDISGACPGAAPPPCP